jgi:hypothetical protein
MKIGVGAPIAAYLYGPIGFFIFINVFFLIFTSATLDRASVDTALNPRKYEVKQKYYFVNQSLTALILFYPT